MSSSHWRRIGPGFHWKLKKKNLISEFLDEKMLSFCLPVLTGAESPMMGENILGFISCIERGVRGVNVPPEISDLKFWKFSTV